MSDRVYDIVLNCGCMISLAGGGGLIACDGYDDKPNTDCKYYEEYLTNPNYAEWEAECARRNI